MNKEQVYEFLKKHNIWYEITEHPLVTTIEELTCLNLAYPFAIAKNIFVRDDKKRNYYLITIQGSKKIDLKKFQVQNNTRHLSFASSEDLKNILNLTPGSVTPLGLLNDKELKVKFYLDSYFYSPKSIIGVHPNINTATVWLKTYDLIKIIEFHGTKVHIIDI